MVTYQGVLRLNETMIQRFVMPPDYNAENDIKPHYYRRAGRNR